MAKKPTKPIKKAKTTKPKAKDKPKSKVSVAAKEAKKKLFTPPTIPAKDLSVAAPKRKYGSPVKYKPEYCDMLIDFMSKGYSVEAFCGHINTTFETMYRWLKHPDYGEFRQAKKIGEGKQREFWEQAGRLGLMGKIKGFNTSVWIFNMKNRYGWNDKRVEEETKEFDSIVIELPNSKQQQIVNMGTKTDDIINVTPKDDK